MSRQALCLVLFGAALAACVPPTQQPAGGGASPRVAAGGGGGGCDEACARLLDCHLIADSAACVQECTTQGFGPDVTSGLANGTCADDGAWLAQTYPSEYGGDSGYSSGGGGGGEGMSCTGGDSTCGGYTVCCASGGGQAAYGAAGVCHQVSVCNMPTR